MNNKIDTKNFDLRPLDAAHARAVNALLGNIPKLSEDEACEIVESMTALMLETLKHFLPGEDDESDYN